MEKTTVSGWADPFVLCASILISYYLFSPLPISTPFLGVIIVAIAIAVMATIEWLRLPKYLTKHPLREIFSHSTTVWLGTLGGLSIVLIGWSMLTEYRRPDYAPFFHIPPIFLVAAFALSALAIFAAEILLGPSDRGGYQLGLLLRGRTSEINWMYLRDDLITWFMRGFFLPINFSGLVLSIDVFRYKELNILNSSWVQSEYYILLIIFAVILAAVTPGYVFGSRLIRTNTTAVDHTFFGWTVTLACYAPFWPAIVRWFDYNPITPHPIWYQPWASQLQNLPTLMAIVGAAIIFCALVHLWAEAQFGIRSSNLSNRGIITTGPFLFTKHPVYVSKCIGWFLIWVPFLAGGNLFEDIRLTVLFACVCGIYILRSLAEEKLLSTDPVYVAYALSMDERGIFKKVGQLVPSFSYAWRLAYWQRTAAIQKI